MSMKRILLPEPPPPFAAAAAVPEIFGKGQQSAVIRRAVIIGNGLPGAESQSMGLLRALGLGPYTTLHRVSRPVGPLNEHLRWLPVAVHRQLDRYVLRLLAALARVAGRLASLFLSWLRGRRVKEGSWEGSWNQGEPWQGDGDGPAGWSQGGSSSAVDAAAQSQSQPLLALVPPPVEADARQIAETAQDGLRGDQGPLLVVACGRDTVSLAATVKKLAGPAAFVVQIQQPRCKAERFDLVVTPQHDFYALSARAQSEIPRWMAPFVTPPLPGRNVVLTAGALHFADAAMLRSAATTWQELGTLPKPLVVVNIGGPTRHCQYGPREMRALAATLRQLQDLSGGYVRVSFSRRTPPRLRQALTAELESLECIDIWQGDGPNPHFGHLAWGDAFVVTADSVSMISEACSTGKPVYVVGQKWCKWKLAEFHRTLHRRGCTRPLLSTQDMNEFWSYPPLKDSAEVAARVRDELAKRGCILPA